VSELAEEFEPAGQTIRTWIKKADIEDGVRSDGTTADEREELRRLRKENRRLKQERDILPGKPRPGSLRRPMQCPRNLRVHGERIRPDFPSL